MVLLAMPASGPRALLRLWARAVEEAKICPLSSAKGIPNLFSMAETISLLKQLGSEPPLGLCRALQIG